MRHRRTSPGELLVGGPRCLQWCAAVAPPDPRLVLDAGDMGPHSGSYATSSRGYRGPRLCHAGTAVSRHRLGRGDRENRTDLRRNRQHQRDRIRRWDSRTCHPPRRTHRRPAGRARPTAIPPGVCGPERRGRRCYGCGCRLGRDALARGPALPSPDACLQRWTRVLRRGRSRGVLGRTKRTAAVAYAVPGTVTTDPRWRGGGRYRPQHIGVSQGIQDRGNYSFFCC